ncbi:hypothetical protein G6M04_14410 [Agrobacterium rhizogenes]|uniref:hypothetical protein n=1 Tax=Rhizobium rhizogenes TaxID=359 RepID=UPI001571DA59|nr:hypothetical protein [Rhizobium rhizogenes]NTG48582.1 hypothetical protein [Rhizobium rhizogenes]
MLTRRGLFGLAAGGAVAAPTLLKGEQPFPSVGVIGEIGPELVNLPQSVVTIECHGTLNANQVLKLAQKGVRQALAEYGNQQRQIGFGPHRPRYESQKG